MNTRSREIHILSSVLGLAASTLIGSAACDEGPGLAPLDTGAATSALASASPELPELDAVAEDHALRHPLLEEAGPRTGQVPFAVTQSAADGRRLAVEEGRFVDETGRETFFSGIRAIERRALTATEHLARTADKRAIHGTARAATVHAQRIGPVLTEMLGHEQAGTLVGTGDDKVEVIISTRRPVEVPLYEEIEHAMAAGRIATRADRERVRGDLLAARRARVAMAQDPVIRSLQAMDAEILARGENMHFVVALVPLSAVPNLARDSAVMHVELHTPDDDEVSGADIIKGHQINQLIHAGYDGENLGYSHDLTFAQVESGAAHDEHPGFTESSSARSRIRGLFTCESQGCSATNTFSPGQETGHATSVAGIIFGDLRDGQDRGLNASSDRVARSGYAGEARGWLYRGTATLAFDHIAGLGGATAPAVVNMSAGKADADPTCLGQDSRSRAANQLFESGKLLIKSAGNEDHASTTDCTVTSPGSALGVLTVASTGAGHEGDADTVRNATISSFSARGGTSDEGGGRTIVDLAAYGYRGMLFDDRGGYSRSGGGTSYAAPTVTATALDFIDHYKHEYSDLIDNPGILAVNLLLMGDRQTQGTARGMQGFDNLYGAGRLRPRRFDQTGMDAPWGYSTGYVCIDEGEVYTLPINEGVALPPDVDVFKAVLWWYDSRHEIDGTLDDIDLSLETTSGATLRSSMSLDNKERVFYQGAGGKVVKLAIHGYRITADDTGCGQNSMKVYWAYFYEDSDRDDIDGPGSDIPPE